MSDIDPGYSVNERLFERAEMVGISSLSTRLRLLAPKPALDTFSVYQRCVNSPETRGS
jgi:hypothetical protein